MGQDNKESEFKVVDKRRFSSDGSRGSETASESEATTEPKVSSENTQEATSSNPSSESSAGNEGQLDFASFLMSLAHQTLVLLGQAPNPETNLIAENLEAAKQTIDILGMLEEKTKGNLTSDEEKLFIELLAGLRLAYVQKTTGGS